MPVPARPHLIGIDDGPFEKGRDRVTPLVGVITEGADLVEGVSVREFPVDGAGLTSFLADWIAALPFRPGLHGVVVGGVTAAGLAVLDGPGLAAATGLPVLVVSRKANRSERLVGALRAAGLTDRIALIDAAPTPFQVAKGLFAAASGIRAPDARALLRASLGKSALPEPLRLAHLIATALVRGDSRGRP